jgi:hypothetical protein
MRSARPGFRSVLFLGFFLLLFSLGLCCEAGGQTLRVGAYDNYPKVFFSNDKVLGIFPKILEHVAGQ